MRTSLRANKVNQFRMYFGVVLHMVCTTFPRMDMWINSYGHRGTRVIIDHECMYPRWPNRTVEQTDCRTFGQTTVLKPTAWTWKILEIRKEMMTSLFYDDAPIYMMTRLLQQLRTEPKRASERTESMPNLNARTIPQTRVGLCATMTVVIYVLSHEVKQMIWQVNTGMVFW